MKTPAILQSPCCPPVSSPASGYREPTVPDAALLHLGHQGVRPYTGWLCGWGAVLATVIVLSNLAGVAVTFSTCSSPGHRIESIADLATDKVVNSWASTRRPHPLAHVHPALPDPQLRHAGLRHRQPRCFVVSRGRQLPTRPTQRCRDRRRPGSCSSSPCGCCLLGVVLMLVWRWRNPAFSAARPCAPRHPALIVPE
jgi:hypothetical protein